MSDRNELDELQLLARIDALTAEVADWAQRPVDWQPIKPCQALLERVLKRVHTLRVRLEAPIVVALFGGTGTGKSSLVNALVGRECVTTGRERPTTRRPTLLAHPETVLDVLELPLPELDVVTVDADLLRSVVLIDCPDPDTSDAATPGSNLARVQRLLPVCDVLIYTTTQQKYRSARVGEELGRAAAGCRLIFVQTHADLDDDVREDWREQLRGHYEVPEVLFVDSVESLREQAAGGAATGDLARLKDLLTTQTARGERVRIRRANVLDLLSEALERCRESIAEDQAGIAEMEQVLDQQQRALTESMARQLETELLGQRNLWERRLISAVTDSWSLSPFSAALRIYNSFGSLITSIGLFRARSTAQMALLGAVQGSRWLAEKQRQRSSEQRLGSAFSLSDERLRETELVVAGHAAGAGLTSSAHAEHSLDALRMHAADMEQEFLDDAGRRTNALIAEQAERNSRWYVRAGYETALGAYLAFILYRVGRNFFVDSWLSDAPLLDADFYVPALLFLVLVCGLLIMAFTRRLRRGLSRQIRDLAASLVTHTLSSGLFPGLRARCAAAREAMAGLARLQTKSRQLRDEFAVPEAFGAPRLIERETAASA